MTENEANQLWATLGEEGKAPTELSRASRVLPSYSVAIGPWLDRLARRYLQTLCREAAHFKLVMAPYGGGKTHFLLALGARALEENFAVAYVPCGEGVSLDSPMDVYKEFVKHLQLPDELDPGLRRFLKRVVRAKREAITKHGAPDVDVALRRWISHIRKQDYPENAFGRVMAAALMSVEDPDASPIGEAAVRWLQGDVDALTKEEMSELRLARVPASNRKQLGRNLLLSIIKFMPEAGVHGLVLLMDEVETLFTARGKALLRILAAMRVLVDVPTGVSGGLPMLGVFSAVPDVLDQLPKYPALEQRLAVRGATFQEGNDLAIQLPLEKVESQQTLLAEIGRKLIDVGHLATGHKFTSDLQAANAALLAQIAAERNLDVDARRIYVKTWVNLLNIQSIEGERELGSEELSRRYRGFFESLRDADSAEFEP
jgi:P-loop Domain of unknown function (DUF2791)